MALFDIHFSSGALGKQSSMLVTVPEKPGRFAVVYQLHGHSDDHTIWTRRTSIERYAEAHDLIIVMPDGGLGFYADAQSGLANHEQHILETVRFIDRTLPTIPSAAARGIGGLSMGGYGCIKLALKHPDLFASAASHSGALDVGALCAHDDARHLHAIFGRTAPPGDDCFALAAAPGPKPAMYIDCGVDDFLIGQNRDFHAHLDKLGIAHEYHEHPGAHNWEYWDRHIDTALRFHRRLLART